MITRKGLRDAISSERALVSSCYNPSLSFIKDIGSYLSTIGKNIQSIEDFFEHKLESSDFDILNRLQAHREQLYSRGRIANTREAVRIEKLEVTMGDKFENIHNATIINRSTVQNAFNKVKALHDEETAQALRQVADEIEKSGSGEAAENFNSFTEELQKPEPKKSVLRTLWNGVTAALPAILQMTDVVTNISKLFTG